MILKPRNRIGQSDSRRLWRRSIFGSDRCRFIWTCVYRSKSYNMAANILKTVCGLVCLVVAIVNAAPSSKLPKGFVQCSLSDPNMDECLKNAAQSAIIPLSKGVPSLGLIKIDPLRISSLVIDQGTGPVNLKLNFTDLDIVNMKSAVITKIHYDPETYNLYIELHPTKPILLEGDYEVSGKVLILPIVGKGKCKINLEISKVIGNVQMKPVIKNRSTYFDIKNLTWKFTASKLDIKLENLFNGDKALGDNMNVFLNENWRELLKELQPAVEDVFGSAFTSIGQQFLNRVPLEQIFKP